MATPLRLRFPGVGLLAVLGLFVFRTTLAVDTPASSAKPWKLTAVKLPNPMTHPLVACTPEELARLKAALKLGTGDVYWTVMDPIKRARQTATESLVFPPRGGQHNQWYQCDTCQLALQKVDDTHHRCSKCGKVYSGPPYDDVIFSTVHYRNLSRMTQCAWAWAVAEDAACADFATKVLLGYAERYETYPYHDNAQKTGSSGGHLEEQTLDEAMAMASNVAPAYDLLYHRLTPDERKKIEAGLILPMLKNIDKHKAGKSNWQTWHNAAMLAGGAVMGDSTWVEKALSQPGNGFVSQMETSVTADGMWYENSWGYHNYTLMAMVLITEDARRLGIDLWSHPKLKKMFTLAALYTMADGQLPRFADDVSSSAKGNADRLEPAYAVYKDPALLPVLPDKPNWYSTLSGRAVAASQPVAADPAASAVFTAAGHAILRSNGPAGLTGAMTFGPYGGFHGHFDKLSFVLYGFGEELGVDPGRAKSQAYRLPIHTHWYKNTLAHNAVVIDGRAQWGAEGKLELFAANAQFTAVKASCDRAYKGFNQTRLLVMTPEYLLVVDHNAPAAATAPGGVRFDWVYHGLGDSVECELATAAGKLPDKTEGAEYIQNLKTGKVAKPDQAVQAKITGKNVTTHLTFDAQPDTTVYIGDGPFGTVNDRVPLVIVERARGDFVAAIEPVKKGAQPTVTAVKRELARGGGGGEQITVTRTGGHDLIVIGADNKTFTLTRNGKPVLTLEGK